MYLHGVGCNATWPFHMLPGLKWGLCVLCHSSPLQSKHHGEGRGVGAGEEGGRERPGEGAGRRELYYFNNTPKLSVLDWRGMFSPTLWFGMNIHKLRQLSVQSLPPSTTQIWELKPWWLCVYIQEKEIQPRLEPGSVRCCSEYVTWKAERALMTKNHILGF